MKKSPLSLRIAGEFFIKIFCRRHFLVEGGENVKKDHSGSNFIIASSHFCNLDANAAVKVFGGKFNLLLAIESVLFKSFSHLILILLGGRSNFAPLSYYKKDEGKMGAFSPHDFNAISDKMKQQGKTTWIAIHPFTLDGQMKRARIGSVYLAQKTGAQIIPVAVEASGASVNLEGLVEQLKGLLGGTKIKYHIGESIRLSPIDIEIIETVFNKRKAGLMITPEERVVLKKTHILLKNQADMVATIIAKMLPEEQRGFYNNL